MTRKTHNTFPITFNAVVYDDGSGDLANAVFKSDSVGRITGNGTLQQPLGILPPARNLIEHAAALNNVDDAAKLICDALGITDGDVAGANLPRLSTWAMADTSERLMWLSRWLQTEALVLIPQDQQDASKAEFQAYGRPENA